MRKSGLSAYGKLIWALGTFTVLAGAAVVAKLYFGDALARLSRQVPEQGSAAIQISYSTEYAKCGDILVEIVEIPAGEFETSLVTAAAEWGIPALKDESGAKFRKKIDDYCPEHANYRLITLSKGFVAVFRGKRLDPAFLIKEYRGLPESALHERDRELLRAGVILEGEPDEIDSIVARYLEGIEE